MEAGQRRLAPAAGVPWRSGDGRSFCNHHENTHTNIGLIDKVMPNNYLPPSAYYCTTFVNRVFSTVPTLTRAL